MLCSVHIIVIKNPNKFFSEKPVFQAVLPEVQVHIYHRLLVNFHLVVFFFPLQTQFEFLSTFPDRYPTKQLERVLHVLVHYSENNGFCLSVADQKIQN